MSQSALTETGNPLAPPGGLQGVVADWSSDQRAFKRVPWGKAKIPSRFDLRVEQPKAVLAI